MNECLIPGSMVRGCEAQPGGNGWSNLKLTSAAVFWSSATAEPYSG